MFFRSFLMCTNSYSQRTVVVTTVNRVKQDQTFKILITLLVMSDSKNNHIFIRGITPVDGRKKSDYSYISWLNLELNPCISLWETVGDTMQHLFEESLPPLLSQLCAILLSTYSLSYHKIEFHRFVEAFHSKTLLHYWNSIKLSHLSPFWS